MEPSNLIARFWDLQSKVDEIARYLAPLEDVLRQILEDDRVLVRFVREVELDEVEKFYTYLRGECERVLKLLAEIRARYALG